MGEGTGAGEGSSASLFLSVGDVEGSGSLSTDEFLPSNAYLGKGLGGEGSWEAATSTDVGVGAGRAIVFAMRRARMGERIETFMLMVCMCQWPMA